MNEEIWKAYRKKLDKINKAYDDEDFDKYERLITCAANFIGKSENDVEDDATSIRLGWED